MGDTFKNPETFADDIQINPKGIWNRTPEEIEQYFRDTGYQTPQLSPKKGTSGFSKQIRIDGHPEINKIQVHPGGGRPGGSYIKVSTTKQGLIKIVDSTPTSRHLVKNVKS